jgi:hypothetical protein
MGPFLVPVLYPPFLISELYKSIDLLKCLLLALSLINWSATAAKRVKVRENAVTLSHWGLLIKSATRNPAVGKNNTFITTKNLFCLASHRKAFFNSMADEWKVCNICLQLS